MTDNNLIVGLDYGTTYTGVSYCEISDGQGIEPNIQVIQNWPAEHSMIGTKEKVPSEIAYTHEGISWGSQIPTQIQRHTWTKLELDRPRDGEAAQIRKELSASAYGVVGGSGYGGLGGVKRPVDIVADFLAEIKKHLIQNLDEQYGKELWRTLSITLVITVPAVWSDAAKNLTLQAIEKAGFNTTELPQLKRTITATEPEAAAIHTIKSLNGSVRVTQMEVGDGFVVCDMGGGTVDLISYRITGVNPITVQEATIGTGDQCGGSFVDRAFLKWFEDKVGAADFVKVAGCSAAQLSRTSLPAKLGKMVQEFSLTAKVGFKGSQTYYLRLPAPLGSITDQERGMGDGDIRITADDMKRMFEYPLQRTSELLKNQLQQAQLKNHAKVKYVFLVGGFAESPYMRQQLRELVEANGAEVYKPIHAWSAIVRGATAKGLECHGQTPVKARKCRRYYGTPSNQPFNRKKHRKAEAYTCPYTGEKRARHNANWLIVKGQDLPTDTTVHGKIQLLACFWSDAKRSSNLVLLASDADVKPLRSNEADVYEVANLVVDLSPVPERKFRKRRSKCGNIYYELDITIDISVQSTLEYSFLVDGVRYGTVTADYA